MTGPTLADDLAAILSAKELINKAFEGLEAISPDVLKGPEEVLRQAIATAVAPLDPVIVGDSLVSVGKVFKEGGGIVGGGFNANLA